jgi:hypothetical protein
MVVVVRVYERRKINLERYCVCMVFVCANKEGKNNICVVFVGTSTKYILLRKNTVVVVN